MGSPSGTYVCAGPGRRSLGRLGPVVSLVLFALALWVLHRELHAYGYRDITRHLQELPGARVLLALALTAASYLALTGFDALALRYVARPLAYRKIASASFIGYAFTHNLGLSLFSGAPVRYRLYSAWGLPAADITRVVVFCALTGWLGFFGLCGLAFLVEPRPAALHLSVGSVRLLGAVLCALVAAYLILSAAWKKPLVIWGQELSPPRARLALAQVALAALDWSLAAAVLYVLLPVAPGLSYVGFVGLFLLAQVAGVVSQVPGGLGVFETAVILMLLGTLPAPQVLSSLLVYRVVYYLLPLGLAALLLAAHELLQRWEGVARAARVFGLWGPWLVPHVLAATTFLSGALLLLSGAMPTPGWRLAWLRDFLPLPVLEVSHFLGSLTGVGLLVLARGLQRRLDAAYLLAVGLLGAGIVLSLLRGLHLEAAAALAVMLVALLPARPHFYRRASLISERFTPGWTAAIVLAVASSIWLGVFSYKHVEYSSELWWRFSLSADAPRFLRATVGAIGGVLFFALASLLRVAPAEPVPPGEDDLRRAAEVVERSPHTLAYLALVGDKDLLFSDNGRAFLMYAVEGRSWVALGDPVGPEEEWPELVWRFREMADRHDGWTVFYRTRASSLHLYLDLGLTAIKLGEEAHVPLAEFAIEGGAHRWLRRTVQRLEREGVSFEVRLAAEVAGLLPELKAVSDAWLAAKETREKGFSLGFFSDDYLRRFPVALALREGRVAGFANVLLGAGKEELSVDLIRYRPEVSEGLMDYLLVQLMLWGKREGWREFNLGMAAFSGLEDHALAPLWNRLGALIFRHGEHFHNFQGLRRYKEKFGPCWESKYLASPGGLALPRILANIASLIMRGKGAR